MKNEIHIPGKYSNCKPIKYDVDENNCWICTSHAPDKRRGYYFIKREYDGVVYKKIHRLLFAMYVEKIKDGNSILHKCNNAHCINPDHLYQGDNYQNMSDRKKIGRYFNEYNGQVKLTEERVKEIKTMLKNNVDYKQIAEAFNVSVSTIRDIKNERTWKRVKI